MKKKSQTVLLIRIGRRHGTDRKIQMIPNTLLRYDMMVIMDFYEQQILNSGNKDPQTYFFTLLKDLKTQKIMSKQFLGVLEELPIYADKVRKDSK